MTLTSKNVIAAAKRAYKLYPEREWRAFYNGFMEGFGFLLTNRSSVECARLLAWLLDTQPIQLRLEDRLKIEKAIRKYFSQYDPDVANKWPACLGEKLK